MMTQNSFANKQVKDMVPEIFEKHLGTWDGVVVKVDAMGQFQSTFSGRFTIQIDGCNYWQVNSYRFPDGSIKTLRFEGQFEDSILTLRSSDYPEFSAIAWDAGNDIILFRSSKIEGEKRYIYIETMTLTGSNSRVRSSQIFRDGIFDGITCIEETRQGEAKADLTPNV
jgi:Domain of unknown function (DUF3598)